MLHDLPAASTSDKHERGVRRLKIGPADGIERLGTALPLDLLTQRFQGAPEPMDLLEKPGELGLEHEHVGSHV
ncbi:MAG: hypothetical protein ACREOQ_23245 [Gemmatimonadales bacterium]